MALNSKRQFILPVFLLISLFILTFQQEAVATSNNCKDTPNFDPITAFESLPVHVNLLEKVTGYNQPEQITCSSKKLTYKAVKTGDKASVISRYKSNRRLHAELTTVFSKEISGNYGKHGVIRSYWPNGAKQAIEYYCNGFAVGFHEYFNENGKLSNVVDYTKSDYERHKKIGPGKYRNFYQGKSNWANADLSEPTQLFREVYALENDKFSRKAFAISHIFSSRWIALDNHSAIEQWTKPGEQGEVLVENRPFDVINNDFEYLPFTEVYQRHKMRLAYLRKPQSYNPELLTCPWLDDAMKLGLEEGSFKFKQLVAYSAAEISSTPQARYAACIAAPNADCLYEQAYGSLKYETNQKQTFVNGFGRATLMTGYPEWTQKAMAETLKEITRMNLPDPWFAEPASLKAQAEILLGHRDLAEETITSAFEYAFTEQPGTTGHSYKEAISAVTPLFLLTSNPIEKQTLRKFFDFSERKDYREYALNIIENSAIALIRKSKFEEAKQISSEFPSEDNKASAFTVDSVKEYQVAHEHNRYSYLRALLALAQGRLNRGDTVGAKKALGEVTMLAPNYAIDKGYARSNELAVKAAEIYTGLGDIDQALNVTKDIFVHNYQNELTQIAINLCKAGDKSNGTRFADIIRRAKLDIHPMRSHDKVRKVDLSTIPYVAANLAGVEYACGDKSQALASLKELLQNTDKPEKCRSDFCGSPYSMAIDVRKAVLKAGLVDLVSDQKIYDDPFFILDVALQRAKNGDATGALATIDQTGFPSDNPQLYKFKIGLIRAQILTLLGNTNDAAKEYSNARVTAINFEDANSRSTALIEIAKSYLQSKKRGETESIINELFATPDAINGCRFSAYPHTTLDDTVRILAETGMDLEAQNLAWSMLQEERLVRLCRKYQQKSSKSHILGEMALHQYVESGDTESLAEIKTVQPFRVRLNLWLNAIKVAEKNDDEDGTDYLKTVITDDITALKPAMNTAMSYPEKRKVIHDIAFILRHNYHNLTDENRLNTLNLLGEQAHTMDGSKEGAKTLCELGYTATRLKYAVQADNFFDDGAEKALKLQPRTFPIDEPASGACAFWIKSAGDSQRAKLLIDKLLKQMPKSMDDFGYGSIDTLLNVPIAFAESEKGEVDWLTNSIFEP